MNVAIDYRLTGDCVVFSILQLIFLASFVYVYIYDKGWLRAGSGFIVEVKRGEKSWGYFHTVYGFLSIIFLEIINTTDAYKGYKTLITILDLSALLYLCFFSSWFRNKIVGVASKSKELIEN